MRQQLNLPVLIEDVTVFLEEPESNLHPNLQSKLAELIISCTQWNRNSQAMVKPKFIIETHSEYFIRKLQYLVGTEKIDNSKISLHYFEMNRKGKNKGVKVNSIKIKPDGVLSQPFCSGFLDEADNIAMSLFSLKNIQAN